MYDTCEVCIYAKQNIDIVGHIYYTCDIQNLDDNNPDHYPEAECCNEGDKDNG